MTRLYLDALEDEGIQVVRKMNAIEMGAMFSDANLGIEARRVILKHLREHFGKDSFSPLHSTKRFGEGYTTIKAGMCSYKYAETGISEQIPWSIKNVADEVATQLQRELNERMIKPSDIKRIDIALGGDHGKGAFIFSADIVLVLQDNERIYNEVAIGEIICRKDTAELIEMTILPFLTQGMKQLSCCLRTKS